MRISVWAESLFRVAVLLFVLYVPLQAAAGVQIDQFRYFKIEFSSIGVPIGGTSFADRFDAGGPLDSGGLYDWQIRIGTILDKDEDFGLHLKPWSRGAAFQIGGHETRAQILELQTPLTGSAAINDTRSDFAVTARYEIGSYVQGQVFAGVGLTDVFRGGGTRGIAATLERDGGVYYGKFSNALTGDILDRQQLTIPAEARFIELHIEHADRTSDSVRAGYAFLDTSGIHIEPVRYFSGLALAFSDVVLSPVIFAAVPIPEAETWALLLVGLVVVGCRVRYMPR